MIDSTVQNLPAGLAHQAQLEIEYLRRWYAKATDLIGQVDNVTAVAEGRKIYDRIFTPQVSISVGGEGAKPLAANSPAGWVDVVKNALERYAGTQHLIGTQLVELSDISVDGTPPAISAGRAHMTSYLQAWHHTPERQLRMVMGTYVDEVVFTPGVGWQIEAMQLLYTAEEHRELGAAEQTG